MRATTSRLLAGTGAIAAGATALAFAAYRKDIKAARQRIETRGRIVESARGRIEYAEAGEGPPVLLIHGAGGGFDQGLELGRAFLGDGYRVLAPSRFGYLGTPLPADASAEAQADAHLTLIDALHLDRVAVIGVSAGAPSAMQFCLRHAERSSALGLIVPLAYAPKTTTPEARAASVETMLNAIVASDFVFWSATRLAHSALLETILGTPVENYRKATPDERRSVDDMLRGILPISRRSKGIWNESAVASTLTRYALEDIRVPTLVMSAEDDLYGTYEGARYTAGQIRDAKFVGFPTGGHLLVGHEAEVRSRVADLMKAGLDSTQRAAMTG